MRAVIACTLLVAALFALHLLPIHLASLAVLIAAIVLLLLEAKYPSHGALAIAGTSAWRASVTPSSCRKGVASVR